MFFASIDVNGLKQGTVQDYRDNFQKEYEKNSFLKTG